MQQAHAVTHTPLTWHKLAQVADHLPQPDALAGGVYVHTGRRQRVSCAPPAAAGRLGVRARRLRQQQGAVAVQRCSHVHHTAARRTSRGEGGRAGTCETVCDACTADGVCTGGCEGSDGCCVQVAAASGCARAPIGVCCRAGASHGRLRQGPACLHCHQCAGAGDARVVLVRHLIDSSSSSNSSSSSGTAEVCKVGLGTPTPTHPLNKKTATWVKPQTGTAAPRTPHSQGHPHTPWPGPAPPRSPLACRVRS